MKKSRQSAHLVRVLILLSILFLCCHTTACSYNDQHTSPTGGSPISTPSVYYQGTVYNEQTISPNAISPIRRYEEVGTVAATVTEDWPAEEWHATALKPGTVIYRGVKPWNGKDDGYLYVKIKDSYVMLGPVGK